MIKFIGQRRISKELNAIAEQCKKDKTQSVNILLRGKAGCGKTLMARLFLQKVCSGLYSEQIPAQFGFKFLFSNNIKSLRGHFVDEVHTIKNAEQLYPLMNSKKYVFMFATNLGGDLPEAFLSRCFEFTFDDYTNAEIKRILLNYGKVIKFSISSDTAKLIAENCRGNPRMAEKYLERLKFIIDGGYYPKTIRGINAAFKDIGVYAGGYTEIDMRYLKFLEKNGTSSLNVLTRGIGVDKYTVENVVEPFLQAKGHIQITARGRKFVSWEEEEDFVEF
jgi:Holliday junction DNA helicase RuvB